MLLKILRMFMAISGNNANISRLWEMFKKISGKVTKYSG